MWNERVSLSQMINDNSTVGMFKSKMVAFNAIRGNNFIWPSKSWNKSPEPPLDSPTTLEHMSALLLFKFPAFVKYGAILDSLMTTTHTMHIRAAKALFDVIMHKVCCWLAFRGILN